MTSITFFFFNDTATTEIYTLSLHDALPIYPELLARLSEGFANEGFDLKDLIRGMCNSEAYQRSSKPAARSEEHTSELQSQSNLVCRLLLEKKKKNKKHQNTCKIKLPHLQ